MPEPLHSFFSTKELITHGNRYLSNPSFIWILVLSNIFIGMAYTSISISLYGLVKKIKLPFSTMFLAFGTFILACGATHFMEVVTLWTPTYWVSVFVKVITAIASVTTAIALYRIRPEIIRKTQNSAKYFTTEAKFRGLLESAPDGIVVVGTDALILIVNSQAEKMFGYRRDELLGNPIEILVPEKHKQCHIGFRSGYIDNPVTRPMGAGRALTGRKKDGTEFPIEISLSPVETEQGTLITSIIRDITDRRKSEEQLESSLREKEALLKEIHHRVKNNLQVTSSLLKLQAEYIPDAKTREIFAESQNRIRSMALVHEKLYRSSDLSRINFSEYLENLARLLFGSFGIDFNRIRLNAGKNPVFLSVEPAVPCGLIVNELISNCLKHAFPAIATGEISVNIEREAQEITIRIADDGVGLPRNFDLEKPDTLGLQLVHALVKQLNGQIQVNTKRGTEFIITFSESKGSQHE